MNFREYFETRYCRATNPDPRQLKAMRQTVQEFIGFAGEDVRPEEVTPELLNDFKRSMKRSGISGFMSSRKANRIRGILADTKAAETEPEIISEAPTGSLAQYIPQFRKLKGKLPTSPDRYARAVAAFNTWYGGDVFLDEMSPELVDEFEESGTRPADRQHAGAIRSIMQTIDPAVWRKRTVPTAGDEDKERPLTSFHLRRVYLDQYEPKALRTKRPNTKRLYINTLNQFDKYLGRDATLDDLKDDTVGNFVAWVVETGRSKHTANKHIFNLCAIWRWCCRKGILDQWPDVQLERAPKRSPQAWTKDEIKRLFKAASKFPGRYGDVPACDWWKALILVLWDSCERVGAASGLQWKDVNLDTGWVRFDADNRKGGIEDSDVELSPETVEALRAIKGEWDEVFPFAMGKNYILYNHFERILKAANLPTDAKSKFHRIRRTAASFAEASGGNATELLRHTKREVTKAYIDRKIVPRQQAKDFLFRLTSTRKRHSRACE